MRRGKGRVERRVKVTLRLSIRVRQGAGLVFHNLFSEVCFIVTKLGSISACIQQRSLGGFPLRRSKGWDCSNLTHNQGVIGKQLEGRYANKKLFS